MDVWSQSRNRDCWARNQLSLRDVHMYSKWKWVSNSCDVLWEGEVNDVNGEPLEKFAIYLNTHKFNVRVSYHQIYYEGTYPNEWSFVNVSDPISVQNLYRFSKPLPSKFFCQRDRRAFKFHSPCKKDGGIACFSPAAVQTAKKSESTSAAIPNVTFLCLEPRCWYLWRRNQADDIRGIGKIAYRHWNVRKL